MNHEFKLPNGKEVEVKEFLYKHVREFFYDKSLLAKAEFLNSFIVTKNLNVLEKFITLLKLRERCIKQSINLKLNKKDKEVSIDYILKSFDEIVDIREVRTVDNITLVLDYPSEFVVNTDSLFSVIQSIQIDNDKIDITKVTNEELLAITNSLPASVLAAITDFIQEKKEALSYSILSNQDSLNLNFLNISPFVFLDSLFNCIDPFTYREYIFVLSKRMKDITFLVNSTFVDILDYMELYKRENEDQNEKLQK
tara:strand:- start:213 stop:971 length:759 start_codon:yes stop_codon:yes gene_type:complete